MELARISKSVVGSNTVWPYRLASFLGLPFFWEPFVSSSPLAVPTPLLSPFAEETVTKQRVRFVEPGVSKARLTVSDEPGVANCLLPKVTTRARGTAAVGTECAIGENTRRVFDPRLVGTPTTPFVTNAREYDAAIRSMYRYPAGDPEAGREVQWGGAGVDDVD